MGAGLELGSGRLSLPSVWAVTTGISTHRTSQPRAFPAPECISQAKRGEGHLARGLFCEEASSLDRDWYELGNAAVRSEGRGQNWEPGSRVPAAAAAPSFSSLPASGASCSGRGPDSRDRSSAVILLGFRIPEAARGPIQHQIGQVP